MPELPEVQTTVNGIRKYLKGLQITGVWTDYGSTFHKGKHNIKDKDYFEVFKANIIGEKIEDASRIGKNVLIHISGGKTVVIHMKMTGHLLYGPYEFDGKAWLAKEKGPLRDDPFNRFIRLIFSFANDKHLALSDLRRFAKVSLVETKRIFSESDLRNIGPDPLSKTFTFEKFLERLTKRPNGKIKQVLMDPIIIAGIGNIYSDELLWRAGVHPTSTVSKIPLTIVKKMYEAAQKVLKQGIDFGGDSMSDYRNLQGKPGKFQSRHEAYRRTGEKCKKKGCKGTITRLKIGGRSAHFCNKHQKIYL